MYLDCDTTPPIRSRHTGGSLERAIKAATLLIADAAEGQIGIYESYLGDFRGYVIKYSGRDPYFEPAPAVEP